MKADDSREWIEAKMIAESSLFQNDRLTVAVYEVIAREVLYTRVPVPVPAEKIRRILGVTWKRAYTRIQKLVKQGVLQKWTTTFFKDNRWRRASYYRILKPLPLPRGSRGIPGNPGKSTGYPQN